MTEERDPFDDYRERVEELHNQNFARSEKRFQSVTTDRVSHGQIELDPGGQIGDRVELLCGRCCEVIHYPDGEWGAVACGCEEPPEWGVV